MRGREHCWWQCHFLSSFLTFLDKHFKTYIYVCFIQIYRALYVYRNKCVYKTHKNINTDKVLYVKMLHEKKSRPQASLLSNSSSRIQVNTLYIIPRGILRTGCISIGFCHTWSVCKCQYRWEEAVRGVVRKDPHPPLPALRFLLGDYLENRGSFKVPRVLIFLEFFENSPQILSLQ